MLKRLRFLRIVAVLLLLVAACSGPGGTLHGPAPQVTFREPADGTVLEPGSPFTIAGRVIPATGVSDVTVRLAGEPLSGLEFSENTGYWSVSATAPAEAGVHELTATATYADGETLTGGPIRIVVQEFTRITGTISAGDYVVTICLDENQNLQCDAGEPDTVPAAGGSFEIRSPAESDTEQAVIVAEFRDAAAPAGDPVLTLARPVAWSDEVDVLSTFVAVRMQSGSPGSAAAAYASLTAEYGLAGPESLREAWPDTEEEARKALIRTLQDMRSRPGTGSPAGEAAERAAQALSEALGRYLDAETARLNPLVTAHSLASDAIGSAGSELCARPVVARLAIHTENAEPVIEKSRYLRASLEFSGGAGQEALTVSARIRGRGNTTWHMPKKPFRLKLDEAESLLGLPASRNWALLANYADKTMLRNAVAFCTAELLGLPYTPKSDFAEVTFNGEYLGLYQLSDKVYAVRDVVEARAEESAGGTGPEDAFLLEIDGRRGREFSFDTLHGVPYGFRSETDAGRAAAVEQHLNDIEREIADSANPRRLAAVNALVDLESLVDVFLVNEFTRNGDAFWSSTYAYQLPGSRLTFGPVWDFDLSAGNIDYDGHWDPAGSSILREDGWRAWFLKELIAEPDFRALTRARWSYLSDRVAEIEAYISDAANSLDHAQVANFERWPILCEYVWPNYRVTGSYEGEIAYLLSWVAERTAWMDAEYLP